MKSRIISKKQLLTFSLIFALGIAVFVNWYYTNKSNSSIETETTEKYNLGEAQYVNSSSVETDSNIYFKEAIIKRTKAHDKARSDLNDIINSSNYDNATKQLAKEKLIELSQQIKTETDIENLISAQLGTDCLVTYNSDSIEIVLPSETLDNTQTIKIKNIVISKTKLSAEQISIIEI